MFPHRYPRPKARNLVLSLLLLGALASTAFATGAMADHGQGNTGTIKVHDGPTAEPDERNEPHVTGDVFIEGFNMAAHEGTLNFYAAPPTGDGELVLATTWEDDGGEPEAHFLEGPFFFECGHYRVEAQNGLEEDDFPGGVKSKMFWVDGGEAGCEPEEPPCGEPGGEPCPEEPPCGEPGGEPCPEEPPCGEPGGEPCPEEPEEMVCPTGLDAVANEDGTVLLTFEPAAGSDGTNIYQAEGDGDFEYIATVGPDVTEFLVEDTVPGNAYAFTVTGLYGDEESTDCPVVEVTAIPVFPSAIAFGLATLLGAGAYLALVVRRKA